MRCWPAVDADVMRLRYAFGACNKDSRRGSRVLDTPGRAHAHDAETVVLWRVGGSVARSTRRCLSKDADLLVPAVREGTFVHGEGHIAYVTESA